MKKRMTKPMIHAISLGAGVQSSTMALMFAVGELKPMPDCAIFADTGGEPEAVYRWLDWLESQLPFPVYRVMWLTGLRDHIVESVKGGRFAGAPFYTETDGKREGQLRRQCTREFKIQPITRKLRELCGLAPGQRAPRAIIATQYIGISYDEAIRMKPARQRWIEHRWPLVDLGMTRGHCLEWMESHGYPKPPRSACYFCPYRSAEEWRDLKRNHPADFAKAVEMDKLIRSGVRGTKEKLYLHRSLTPIDEIDLSNAEDAGQQSLFGDECEGMCGV